MELNWTNWIKRGPGVEFKYTLRFFFFLHKYAILKISAQKFVVVWLTLTLSICGNDKHPSSKGHYMYTVCAIQKEGTSEKTRWHTVFVILNSILPKAKEKYANTCLLCVFDILVVCFMS